MKFLPTVRALIFNLMLLVWALPALAVGQTPADTDLIEAHEYHPFYQISNLRLETDGFFKTQVFDIQLTREAKAPKSVVHRQLLVMARTKSGEMRLMTSLDFNRNAQPGTVEVKSHLPKDEPFEVYLALETSIGPNRKRLLVSNILPQGTLDSPVSARKMTDAETEEFDQRMEEINQQMAAAKLREEQRDQHKLELERLASLPPPSEVPEGHTRADINTYLVPGTPIMYGRLEQWMPGEVVFKDGDFITVCPRGSQQVIRFKDPAWIAVKDDVLNEVEQNPKAYQSNLLLLPGGSIVLRDAVPAQGQKITKAMPLCYEANGGWREARFVSADADFAWLLHDGGVGLEKILISKLAVRLKTLEEAKDSSKKREWSEKLQTTMAAAKKRQADRNRQSAESFGYRSRSGKPSSPPKPPKPQKTTVINSPLRTWKDRSGQFEIRAKLLEYTSTKVTLEREDKKQITVEIDSLSAADKQFIGKHDGVRQW